MSVPQNEIVQLLQQVGQMQNPFGVQQAQAQPAQAPEPAQKGGSLFDFKDPLFRMALLQTGLTLMGDISRRESSANAAARALLGGLESYGTLKQAAEERKQKQEELRLKKQKAAGDFELGRVGAMADLLKALKGGAKGKSTDQWQWELAADVAKGELETLANSLGMTPEQFIARYPSGLPGFVKAVKAVLFDGADRSLLTQGLEQPKKEDNGDESSVISEAIAQLIRDQADINPLGATLRFFAGRSPDVREAIMNVIQSMQSKMKEDKEKGIDKEKLDALMEVLAGS